MGDDIFPWPGNKGVPGVGRVTNMEGVTVEMVVGVNSWELIDSHRDLFTRETATPSGTL